MHTIGIEVGGLLLRAELNDSETARLIAGALPINAAANVWGDEIYFGIPIAATEAPDAGAEVEVGTLADRPPGNAFCIFYGPTPASLGSEPRAASPVNIVGHVLDDATQLRTTCNGATVTLSRSR